jgi:hypothetical protein
VWWAPAGADLGDMELSTTDILFFLSVAAGIVLAEGWGR